MPMRGRGLLVAFVAGFLGAALLFALPLTTIRDRVIDLENEHGALQQALNETAAEHLTQAHERLQTWNRTQQASLQEAKDHVDAAAHLSRLASPASSGALNETLAEASNALGEASAADACNMLPPGGEPHRALGALGERLGALGQRPGSEEATLLPVLQAAEGVHEALRSGLRDHAKITGLALAADEAKVRVNLEGPLPSSTCLEHVRATVCTHGACAATNGTEDGFLLEDPTTITIPAPWPKEAGATITVNVSSHAGPVQSAGRANMTAPDGGWPMDIVGLAKGASSQVKDHRMLTIGSEQALRALWSEHANEEEAPNVDFHTRIVLAAFHGDAAHACHDVSITELWLKEEGSLVAYVDIGEQPHVACPAEPVAPFHVIAIPRIPGDVTFVTT